jgi:hypothetical protein
VDGIAGEVKKISRLKNVPLLIGVQNETQAEEGLKEHLLVFNPVEVK